MARNHHHAVENTTQSAEITISHVLPYEHFLVCCTNILVCTDSNPKQGTQ
jgi:hypothetical protein